MTREELAEWLCANVRKRRLARIGEPVPIDGSESLNSLPDDERRNWLDMADAVLEFSNANAPERIQELVSDWVRYTLQLAHDPDWCNEMRRAVVIELRIEVEKLAAECEA